MRYLVTGAAGHLGGAVVRALAAGNNPVRALVMPGQEATCALPAGVEIVTGNVLDPASLKPFFRREDSEPMGVIHCAGLVSVASRWQENVRRVNVEGTRCILQMCKDRGAAKLVYVSSVHAIPEKPAGQVITETDAFDPDLVVGCYAKTKAEATALVLDAAREGLNASVAHPSGLIGPGDSGRGHVTQLLIDFMRGRLKAGVADGGYDFADVRDVGEGIAACCNAGGRGECYILSNRYFGIRELLDIFSRVTGRKPVRTYLPMWLAKSTAHLAEAYYAILGQPPLYTPYSLYTLTSNSLFSHEKADRELGYRTRPMEETVADAEQWLRQAGRV